MTGGPLQKEIAIIRLNWRDADVNGRDLPERRILGVQRDAKSTVCGLHTHVDSVTGVSQDRFGATAHFPDPTSGQRQL